MTDSFDGITEEMENLEDLTMFAQINLGEDARIFVNSALGQFMVGVAKQEIEDCSYQILRTGAWRTRKIQNLQNKAECAANFLRWIQEAINTGDMAHYTALNKNTQ